MEQPLRNALQRTTQQLRTLLEAEYAEQLAGIYDIRRDEPIPERPGKHLRDNGQRLIRRRLVEAVRHKIAAGRTREQAVDDYVREAAFTTLNRFVALKMLEKRDLVQDCVSRGDLSAGYKEFTGLASELALLPDGYGYRLYLECLFDEISTGVKVLFDRRDPAAILWPRRQALADLLAVLNDAEIKEAWDQAETIGWVYQYFNSEQERRQMRDESAAPRDSHELAVRNQFFTPRYVVEFLSDNTLGRTWYEMRHGQTKLAETCRYLVRPPTEIFLDAGQEPPAQESRDDLSQHELVRQPVYVPHRPKKDPRDLKVLDPACGSGHFLLYSFDLFLSIYEEAWADEQAPVSEETGKTLREDYPAIEALRRELPELVLRLNLWGVDIDPRCAQIAAFALWLRAQRAFGAFGIGRGERPVIRRTNIVVAEPMPGEKDMLEEFCDKLHPKILGTLVRQVFEKMQLAGETGMLLKIEVEISDAVETVKKVWQRGPKFTQGNLFRPTTKPPVQTTFHDQYEGTDAQFWEETEDRIDAAFREFAAQSGNGDVFRRKLFRDDAEEGFAFIDVCRQRYDVVLMNPPFGESTSRSKQYLDRAFSDAKADLYAVFVERGMLLAVDAGLVGAITSRVGLFIGSLEEWRIRNFLSGNRLVAVADLGHGVLDKALVEAAAYVGQRGAAWRKSFWAVSALASADKSTTILNSIRRTTAGEAHDTLKPIHTYSGMPNHSIAYWLPESLITCFAKCPPLKPTWGDARVGLQTDDDFRFLRLGWEVPPGEIGRRWLFIGKGGEYSPYYDDIHLVVDWANNASCMRAFIEQRYSWSKNARSVDKYGTPGLTYPERTTSEFSPRPLPAGTVFSIAGPAILGSSTDLNDALLALCYTRLFRVILEMFIGGGDAVKSGSAARHYKAGIVNRCPVPPLNDKAISLLSSYGRRCAELARELWIDDETSRVFSGLQIRSILSMREFVEHAVERREKIFVELEKITACTEQVAHDLYGIDGEGEEYLYASYGPHPSQLFGTIDLAVIPELFSMDIHKLVDLLASTVGYSRQSTKLSHWTDRRYEAIARLKSTSVATVVSARQQSKFIPVAMQQSLTRSVVSFLVGLAFGRWNIDYIATPESIREADLYAQIPAVPPCYLSEAESTPHRALPKNYVLLDDPGHPQDILRIVRGIMSAIWGEQSDAICSEANELLGSSDEEMRAAFRRDFFDDHIKRYSKSRRKAPMFWELAIPSADYAVWVYFQQLNRDTFYKVLNDYVKPKVQHEQGKLEQLRQEAGEAPTRSQGEEIETQEQFVEELRTFQEEMELVAPLWNPNLNDGVLINFAPLWRLVPQHRAWQQECKGCWDRLVAGDYDWSQLAMHLWPERVVPKCRTDASLAIAHGLEDAFWERPAPVAAEKKKAESISELQDEDEGEDEGEAPKKRHRKVRASLRWVLKAGVTDEQVKQLIYQRTSAAVKDALEKLLAASLPAAGRANDPGRGGAHARPSPAALVPATGTEIDLVEQVRKAMQDNGDGVAKNALAKATGLTADQVEAALHKLIDVGDVEKSGAGRGTRYRLLEGKR